MDEWKLPKWKPHKVEIGPTNERIAALEKELDECRNALFREGVRMGEIERELEECKAKLAEAERAMSVAGLDA